MSGARAYIPVCVTASLLLTSSSLFLTFTCPWLAENVSLAFPPCVGITFLFVAANFAMATFADAGVLPKANEDEDKDDDFRAPLYKEVAVRGVQVRMKWCASCHFYRPPRCSHCSMCDHCVEDFDHHCPWVNNCIGRRNYRFFFLFLLSLSVHMVAIFSGGLLFVLAHLKHLWELRAVVTLAIMGMSGLFFIPVIGLACFHLVLVMKGRTTNEQVTGKFQGEGNPFTRGCCGNVEFILCSPITPRFTQYPVKAQPVYVQPPFQNLESLRMFPVKIDSNGIQNEMLLVQPQSAGSLDVTDCKRMNTPPPLPPKPDPVLLKIHLASLQESILHSKASGSAQHLSTVGQSPESPSIVHYQVPREQMAKKESQYQMSNFTQDWVLEPRMEQPATQTPISTHLVLQSSTLPLNTHTLNSRSLYSKHAYCRGGQAHLFKQCPESLVSPSSQVVHSLSYDSLLNQAELAQHGAVQMNYLPSFPPVDLGSRAPSDTQKPLASACSLVFMGTSRQSPAHYDGISKHTMSSIQEEREKQPQACHLLPRQDTGIYDTPNARSVTSRGPTPPAYGSREFLLSSAAYGYASLLRRASRTTGSPIRGNLGLQSRSLSPSTGRALEQQDQSSSSSSMACPMPSSSYTTQKALAFIANSERKHLPPKYES